MLGRPGVRGRRLFRLGLRFVRPQKQLEREYGREAVRRLRLGVYDTLMSYSLDAVRHLDLRYTLPTYAQQQQVAGEGGGGGGEESDAAAATAAEDAEELYGGLLAYDMRDMMSYFHLAGEWLPRLVPTPRTSPFPDGHNLPAGNTPTSESYRTEGCCLPAPEFLGTLLPECGSALFARWALPAAAALCGVAAERPLVSATYRLAATALALTEAAGAFTPPAAAASGAVEAVAAERAGGGKALIAAAEAAAVAELFAGLLRRVAAACGQYKVGGVV